MKDLGVLCYFLRIEVARSIKVLPLSQRKYITDFLEESGMLRSKLLDTPMGRIIGFDKKKNRRCP